MKKDTGLDKARLANRRLNMFLMVQRDISGKLVNNRMYGQQGLDSRLLFVDCPKWNKPLYLTEQDEKDADKNLTLIDAFNDRIFDMLDQRLKTSQDDNCELMLPVMQWEDIHEDRRNWLNSCTLLEQNPANEQHDTWLGKSYEHTVRLAVTLAAFKGLTKIDKASWDCAIELIDFFFQQRINFIPPMDFDEADQTVVAEEEMKGWIKSKFNSGDAVTRQDMSRKGPMSYRKISRVDKQKVVKGLIDDGTLKGELKRGVKLIVK